MTRREAKAVEIMRRYLEKLLPIGYPDQLIASGDGVQMMLEAMQWQADQSLELCNKIFEEYETCGLPVEFDERVSNAGTEVAIPPESTD